MNRRFALLASATLILAGATGAALAGESSEAAVLAFEKQRFVTMVTRDLAALEPMLADDLTYGHSSGATENKAQFLDALRSGRTAYRAIEVLEHQARVIGDVAVVTGRVKILVQMGDNTVDTVLRYTDAYARRAGRWQLIAWQSTRIP